MIVSGGSRSRRHSRRNTVTPNGDLLRRAFSALDLTQDEFIAGKGFTLRTLQRAFAGERISRIYLEKIAAALSLSYEGVLAPSDPVRPPNLECSAGSRLHKCGMSAGAAPNFTLDDSEQLICAANELRLEFIRATEYGKPPLQPENFVRARQLIDKIRHLDGNNGHAHYYAGEIKRWIGMREQSHSDFFRYIDFYENIFLKIYSPDIHIEGCYRSAHGYCGERTAWIHHLLALDLEAEGRRKNDLALLEHGLRHANAALKYFLEGFIQFTPTKSIRDSIQAEIGGLPAEEPVPFPVSSLERQAPPDTCAACG